MWLTPVQLWHQRPLLYYFITWTASIKRIGLGLQEHQFIQILKANSLSGKGFSCINIFIQDRLTRLPDIEKWIKVVMNTYCLPRNCGSGCFAVLFHTEQKKKIIIKLCLHLHHCIIFYCFFHMHSNTLFFMLWKVNIFRAAAKHFKESLS